MNKDIQFLIECLSEDLIAMLIEKYDYSLDEAADVLYKSNTYRLIENIDSELYYQSSVYVFDMLKEEIEQNEREQMKLDMTKNLAVLLMEENSSLTMEQALSIVLNSDTYLRLQRDETRLFYQSPRYVYSFLQAELKTGKME